MSDIVGFKSQTTELDRQHELLMLHERFNDTPVRIEEGREFLCELG